MTPKNTGFVEIREGKRGATFYATCKLSNGKQLRRSLGKVWDKRSQPPAGYITRRQAEAELDDILNGRSERVNVAEPTGVTFKAAADEWLSYLERERQRKRSTLADYHGALKDRLLPYFGAATPVESITKANVEAFKDELLGGERKVSHRTAQKLMVMVHGIMERAVDKDWIAANPCARVEKIRLPKRSGALKVLDVDQVEALARVAESEQLAQMIRVAAFTGLRLGELLALRWRDVDFTDRIIRVERNLVLRVEGTPKSDLMRSVPLSDPAAVALDALSRRELFVGPDDLVFPSETGEHGNGDQVRRAWSRALRAAGLQHMRFHDLRHTFGTLAVRKAPVTTVQAWMGHADVQTTQVYIHHVPQHEHAALLSEAFTGAREALGANSVPS